MCCYTRLVRTGALSCLVLMFVAPQSRRHRLGPGSTAAADPRFRQGPGRRSSRDHHHRDGLTSPSAIRRALPAPDQIASTFDAFAASSFCSSPSPFGAGAGFMSGLSRLEVPLHRGPCRPSARSAPRSAAILNGNGRGGARSRSSTWIAVSPLACRSHLCVFAAKRDPQLAGLARHLRQKGYLACRTRAEYRRKPDRLAIACPGRRSSRRASLPTRMGRVQRTRVPRPRSRKRDGSRRSASRPASTMRAAARSGWALFFEAERSRRRTIPNAFPDAASGLGAASAARASRGPGISRAPATHTLSNAAGRPVSRPSGC